MAPPLGWDVHVGCERIAPSALSAWRGAWGDATRPTSRRASVYLRHTFGTLAVQAWPLTDVKAYMGHAHISTTMIYVHHVPRHDAADRLGALVAAAESAAQDLVPVAA